MTDKPATPEDTRPACLPLSDEERESFTRAIVALSHTRSQDRYEAAFAVIARWLDRCQGLQGKAGAP